MTMEINQEWIDQQRALCGNVKRLNLFSLAEAGKIFKVDMPAALDALEAAYAEITRLTAERDAAVEDMSRISECRTCKNAARNGGRRFPCGPCKWQWRGPCAENAPEGNPDA